MADAASGQLVVHGSTAPIPSKKKKINLLDRSPSPVILEDYGPLEPARCTVRGPGVAGGTVGVATQVNITARDANGVGIREGGERFQLTLQHMSASGSSKTYDSIDHGDGHYTVAGIRADLKGMHQLSVEVNGSLVGDSPYLVMFEVDDTPAQGYEPDAPVPSSRSKGTGFDIKERIVFVQHMHPEADVPRMQDVFGRYGKIVKCDRMLPSKDMWMIQFALSKDAYDALELRGKEIMQCQISVMLAAHAGGVGTHPLILSQLAHLQTLQMQEQQASSLASMLVQQRAAIRESGGEVEELTDTRKKHKAVALMQRLRMKAQGAEQGVTPPSAGGVAQAAGRSHESERDLRERQEGSREHDGERTDGAREHRNGRRGSSTERRAGDAPERARAQSRERSRERDRGRDRERERERDRGRHYGADRERDGRREGHRDRYGRERDRDRAHDRDRERRYGRDREQGRDWGERRDRYRGRSDDRDRDRDRPYRREAEDGRQRRSRSDRAPLRDEERRTAGRERSGDTARDRTSERDAARSAGSDGRVDGGEKGEEQHAGAEGTAPATAAALRDREAAVEGQASAHTQGAASSPMASSDMVPLRLDPNGSNDEA